jgi:tetratricopeptide (TPR) repeat protein
MTETREEKTSMPQGEEKSPLRRWEVMGLVATMVIVLTFPLYLLKELYLAAVPEPTPIARFVGSKECKSCHRDAYDAWHTSHHDLAMDVATEETVLGDFDDATFEYEGIESRFFRKEEKFFVRTEGPEGEMEDFEVTHTFGAYPLQQYLIPFPGGKLQCLSIAWDVKDKKWFRLPPFEVEGPRDWLHWTRAGQTWNAMCAECHSTNLTKGYDVKAGTYETTWSDIDVGCEACHGPGSLHVDWADRPAMARTPSEDLGLVVRTSGLDAEGQLVVCARCHSRRTQLGDYDHSAGDVMDFILPQLVREGMYHADGQILEEVYVYGSFMQSRMYQRGVRCGDCHDVHSLKRLKRGNDLCLACHRADTYDTKEHHFHKKIHEGKPSEGALCEKCHMPGKYYMVNDYRLDHSIRIPRPDLSLALGTPNACNAAGCHDDKSLHWSEKHYTKWYGISRKPHYGTVLAAGREGRPEAKEELIDLAEDVLQPSIVRATALMLLGGYSGDDVLGAFVRALSDEEPLVRHTAVTHLPAGEPGKRLASLVPLLYDPVRAVRMQAAQVIAGIPGRSLEEHEERMYEAALAEYIRSMEYVADFPFGRFNLGNLYGTLGEEEKAEQSYLKAIEIDDRFYPARVNLAMLLNQAGRNEEAEGQLKEVLKREPGLSAVSYSLGLLLAEESRYGEAAEYLSQAARGLPMRPRVHYNLGLVLQVLGKLDEAERALQRTLMLSPDTFDFLHALADHYVRRGRMKAVRPLAERMVALEPENPIGREMLRFIERSGTSK